MPKLGRLCAKPLFGPEGSTITRNATQILGPFRFGPIDKLYELDQNGEGLIGRFMGWFEGMDISDYIRIREHRKLWDFFKRITARLKNRKEHGSLQDKDILEHIIMRIILKDGHDASEVLRSWEPGGNLSYSCVWGFEFHIICNNVVADGVGVRGQINAIWREIWAENNRDMGKPIVLGGTNGRRGGEGEGVRNSNRSSENPATTMARYAAWVDMANAYCVSPADSIFNMSPNSGDWSKTMFDHAHLRDAILSTVDDPALQELIMTSSAGVGEDAGGDAEMGEGTDPLALNIAGIFDITGDSSSRNGWMACPPGANPAQFDDGFIYTSVQDNSILTFGSLPENESSGYLTYSIEPRWIISESVNYHGFPPIFSLDRDRMKECSAPIFTNLAADQDGMNKVSIFDSVKSHVSGLKENLLLPEPVDSLPVIRVWMESRGGWAFNDRRFRGRDPEWTDVGAILDRPVPIDEEWHERITEIPDRNAFRLLRVVDQTIRHPFRGEETKSRLDTYEITLSADAGERIAIAYKGICESRPIFSANLVERTIEGTDSSPERRVLVCESKSSARERTVTGWLNHIFSVAWDKGQPMANSLIATITEFEDRARSKHGDSMEFPRDPSAFLFYFLNTVCLLFARVGTPCFTVIPPHLRHALCPGR